MKLYGGIDLHSNNNVIAIKVSKLSPCYRFDFSTLE